MLDIKDYIKNGRVEREKIALDIRYRDISRLDLDKIVNDPEIQKAFIGKNYVHKKPKEQWNKEYLEELSYVAVAESFNRDYLLYLNEVAEYVSNNEKHELIRHNKGMILAIIVVIVGIIIIVISKCYK